MLRMHQTRTPAAWQLLDLCADVWYSFPQQECPSMRRLANLEQSHASVLCYHGFILGSNILHTAQGRNLRYSMQHQAFKCKLTGGNATRGTPAESTGWGGKGGPTDGMAGQARSDRRDPRGDQRAAGESAGAREPASKQLRNARTTSQLR